jgi:hypothetical protein
MGWRAGTRVRMGIDLVDEELVALLVATAPF